MVDIPRASETLTVAQANAQQIRPYLHFYKTEAILNWELARVNNAYRLINLVLSEFFKNKEGKQEQQIRQLTLEGVVYKQIVWRKGNAADWSIHETIIPMKSGQSFGEIPFYPVSCRRPTMNIIAPPIESLVDVNISHYMNSADLENGAHVSGSPTPYITGIDDTNVTLALGTGTAWLLPNAESKVGFAHVGEDGFSTLEKLLDRKEKQMASLGARMLAPEKNGAEAV
ncbi:DUF4055 domain-containing protein [Dyadobacter sp. CY107]|uniref:DUF4055 domain-containing protein n=1 Tax=Dyadobacter fanqingshengii TaxID=2906443 RepID=UPI001F3004B2|nr:DUF4055 domain-containing protein [Dyadobacter fanqingshengii]MCF2502768.1 DUF4055 domain-containing protein [Dyadobacter fanqingshengii]